MFFYFLHEVRHLIQYSCPSLFSPLVIKSLDYVIQYDGTVFYKDNNEWKQYRIAGADDYLAELYLLSPCEVDANEFALREAQALFPDKSFEHLRKMWLPQYKYFDKNEFAVLFSSIINEIEAACD